MKLKFKYVLKHSDDSIVETFSRYGSAKASQGWYKREFNEELIIEKKEVEK